MAKSAPCAALLALAISAATSRADPPAYPCFQAPVAPVLDGIIEGDPAWTCIPMATGFHQLGGDYVETKQTSARACWDADAIYVGMICDEPDVARMALRVRDGGPTWEDDGVEVFLMPPGGRVMQFVVTAGGAKGGFVGAPDFRKYQAAAHSDANGYCLEIRIPFSLLGETPSIGDRWRGNFCRDTVTTISGGTKFTCWAPLAAQFNEPEHFATLVMHGPAPDPEGVRAVTEEINAAYRARLVGQLRAMAGRGTHYLPVLAEAAGDPRYSEEALELARGWRELRRLEVKAARAPLAELRGTLRDSTALANRSYDLKYAYLIGKLLGD